MDIINSLDIYGDREVVILVSDGSRMRFLVDTRIAKLLESEKHLLVGASIIEFKHDEFNRHIRLDYLTNEVPPKSKFFSFNY